jgi:hypothetical protein
VTIDKIWIGNWIYCLLQLITTCKDYALTVLHTLYVIIEYSRFSQSDTVFTSRHLVASSNSRHPLSSELLNYPQPQLPVSHSNSSQNLNLSRYMTTPNLSYLEHFGMVHKENTLLLLLFTAHCLAMVLYSCYFTVFV